MNIKRKIALSVAVADVVVVLCGCSALDTEVLVQKYHNDTFSNFSSNLVSTSSTGVVEMDDTEKSLLEKLYGDNKREIERGLLNTNQIKDLGKIRFAAEYLNRKYSSETFSFIDIEYSYDKGQNENGLSIRFKDSSSESSYLLTVSCLPYDYECRDNYYSKVLHKGYDSRLFELLSEAGVPVVWVSTDFQELRGFDMGTNTTVDDLFAMGSSLERDTSIYLDSDSFDEYRDAIDTVCYGNRLCGNYTVYYGSELLYASDLENIKSFAESSNVPNVAFSYFDVS